MTRDFETLLRQGFASAEEMQSVVEKRLAQMYAEVWAEVKADIGNLYNKLGDDITLPNAQKYRRLDTLLASLETEYKKLTGRALSVEESHLAQYYAEAWQRLAWATSQNIGLALSWGVIPVDAIRASVYSEYSALSLVKTFAKNTTVELSAIQNALTRAIAAGFPYSRAVPAIQESFQKGFSDAIRVLRTEGTRVYSEGQLAAADRAKGIGIDLQNQWSALKDRRTRDTHGRLDGEVADSEGYFYIDGDRAKAPGLFFGVENNVNCRCRLLYVVDGIKPELERIRGEEGLQPVVPWKQWAESQGWTEKNGWKVAKDAMK